LDSAPIFDPNNFQTEFHEQVSTTFQKRISTREENEILEEKKSQHSFL
jgi:transposase-like protein